MQSTILLIDDEPLCLEMMPLLMYSTNYTIIPMEGGVKGLHYLAEHHQSINLIFLDLMMPQMHGLEVLTEIKKQPCLQDIPVIIQTGLANETEIQEAIALGAACFIRKPYKKSDILAAINQATSLTDVAL